MALSRLQYFSFVTILLKVCFTFIVNADLNCGNHLTIGRTWLYCVPDCDLRHIEQCRPLFGEVAALVMSRLFDASVLVELIESVGGLPGHLLVHIRVDRVNLRIAMTGKAHCEMLRDSGDHQISGKAVAEIIKT